MSLDMCKRCGEPVDTDYDLDCYDGTWLENKHGYPIKEMGCVCENCREQHGLAMDETKSVDENLREGALEDYYDAREGR